MPEGPVTVTPGAESSPAQDDDLVRRVERLEAENEVLRESLDVLFEDHEARQLGMDQGPDGVSRSSGGPITPLGESRFGMSPSASKVYGVAGGDISIGGYGEWIFTDFQGQDDDRADALRTIIYVGHRFSDTWLMNSEIEFEHGSTDDSSGTTSSEGSVSVEFAYIENQVRDDLAVRGGVLLIPVGLVNELHEPTTFPTANRSVTESRILPTTWREMGIGALGDAGPVSWKLYAVGGLEGSRFGAGGLRGGRQKANRTDFDDIAVVLRVDWTETPGLVVGASVYHGDSSQDDFDFNLGTTIVDLHASWNEGPFELRGLWARADIDDTEEFFNATGNALGETLEGWYVEGGVNLLRLFGAETDQAITAYARYEDANTQASLAGGVPGGGGFDDQIVTVGVSWAPVDNVVLKLDYDDFDSGGDRWNALIGYAF